MEGGKCPRCGANNIVRKTSVFKWNEILIILFVGSLVGVSLGFYFLIIPIIILEILIEIGARILNYDKWTWNCKVCHYYFKTHSLNKPFLANKDISKISKGVMLVFISYLFIIFGGSGYIANRIYNDLSYTSIPSDTNKSLVENQDKNSKKSTNIKAVTNDNKSKSSKPSIGNKNLKHEKYQRYLNPRFNFGIDYPSDFKLDNPPDNNDGQKFISPDYQAELTAWGNYNVMNESSQDRYKQEINDILNRGEKIGYKRIHRDWFAISWIEDNKIYYSKEIIRNNEQIGFIISYPILERNYYDDLTSHISSSFKFINSNNN